jgi:predicted RecB family endonuclease
MLGEQVDTGLPREWMSDKATLEEWMERFVSVVSSKEVFNEDALKALATLKEMARNFKTPLKASQDPTNASFGYH